MNAIRRILLLLILLCTSSLIQASPLTAMDTLENCSTIFPIQDSMLIQIPCGQNAQICTNISIPEASIYTIDVNGSRVENPSFCNFDTLGYYQLSESIIDGQLAPYFVEAWRINNQIFSGEFVTIDDLVTSMNEWDPTGNWQFKPAQGQLVGGNPANLYSVLQIEIILNRTTQLLAFRQRFIPNNLALSLPPGRHQIIATNTVKSCRDTLIATVACTRPDTFQLILEENLTRTICLRGDELLAPISAVQQENFDHNSFTWSYAGNDCIRFTGTEIGKDTALFVLCDTLGICDTALVYITTRPLSSRQVRDSLAVGSSGSLCLNRTQLALPGLVTRFENVCSDGSTLETAARFDFSQLCLNYEATVAGKDTICIGMCDTYGNCDTLNFILTVVEPEIIFDTVFLRVDTFMSCLDTSGLVGNNINLTTHYQPLTESIVQFEVDSTTYCVTYAGLQAGTDSLCLWLSDGLGNLKLSLLYVTVVQPTALAIVDTIFINENILFCPDTKDLPGTVERMFNDCPAQPGSAVAFDLSDDFCVSYTGQKLGAEKACIVLCDDLGFCDTTFFTIYVEEITIPPDAVADTATTTQPNSIVISMQDNDNTVGGIIEIIIIEKPDFGRVFINTDGTLTYEPAPDICEGADVFQYAICNPFGCDTATVYLQIDCAEIEIFNAVSPNGDGINDTFFINNIQARPNNQLSIFNRWGNLVFEQKNYQNDWDGTWNGKNLPDGTYFYVLEVQEDGRQRIYRGYLVLHR